MRQRTQHRKGLRPVRGQRRQTSQGTYDYDFGSTTRLAIERTGAREGRIGKPSMRLLVRNDPLPWTCGACGRPAGSVVSLLLFGEHDSAWAVLRDRLRVKRRGAGFAWKTSRQS